MLTGRNFVLLALVVGLCALTTTGCKRRSSGDTTVNETSGIFTTDNFPGDSVQDGNVSDDKRAFSTGTDDYNGGSLVCTHNGDRGTIMVTYQVDGQLFASYYDGSIWTRGVALRHFDVDPDTIDAGEVIHAWINSSNDDRSDAQDRDGDCLIFWNAQDLDSDGGGPDDPNFKEYVSYFDVSHSEEEELNHGFDIDPSAPGFFDAQLVSSLDDAGEDVIFQGLVTDGLCGEARWEDGGNVYEYGNDTTAIFVFWHQVEQKFAGVFDETTDAAGFDLGLVADEEFPLIPTLDVELSITTEGASNSGSTSRESAVDRQYSSYNGLLFYRVETRTGGSFGSGFAGVDFGDPGSTTDITYQFTHFNLTTFTLSNDTVNSVDPDSDAVDIDKMNSGFISENNAGFLGSAGLNTFGRDEGLSCYVTFFSETYDADTGTGTGFFGEDAEQSILIAEVDEDTGTFLNVSENQQLPIDDITVVQNCDSGNNCVSQISRNGDYIWVSYANINGLGASDDYNPEFVFYATTRLDSDGNPVAIPLLTSTLGIPFIFDPEDGVFTYNWSMFQDNLGYICGQQSDPFLMTYFWTKTDASTGDSLIYFTRLTADLDGTVGGETATAATLLIDEDVPGFHNTFFGYNFSHQTFNATDAGQDGDIFYVFTFDDDDSDGLSDVFIDAGRFGVTAASPTTMGSGVFTRQTEYTGNQELMLISTPPGSDIATFDTTDLSYGNGAGHGPSRINLVFREAETASTPISSGGNTLTGYALRTREYRADDLSGTFGDDFAPNAGTTFAKPFDLDLPFIDPDTFDDAEVVDVEVCDDSIVILFEEVGHLYYQEWGSGNGNDVNWRTTAVGISDPALIDDDTAELISFVDEICAKSCTCCQIDGTAIFWVKTLNVSGSPIDRLQVRVINRGN